MQILLTRARVRKRQKLYLLNTNLLEYRDSWVGAWNIDTNLGTNMRLLTSCFPDIKHYLMMKSLVLFFVPSAIVLKN